MRQSLRAVVSAHRSKWWSFFPLIRGTQGGCQFRQFLKTPLTPLIRGETTTTSEHLRAGLTIVEVIVGVAISSILLVALLRFLVAGYPLAKITYLQQQSTETARLQLKRMSKQLREARYSDTGAYPLVEVSPQRLVFYANVDADNATELISYRLVGATLVRGVTNPSGTPLTYNIAANEVVTTVATGVVNGATAIFTYFSGDYPVDDTPLSTVDLTEVKYIQFYLEIDRDTAIDPPAIEIRSQVQLRNLKTNLGQEVMPSPSPYIV